eukprot:CAMPEP_0172190840 /NCGR_PEP_ID=MMETSP1050-20130122/23344_1 /TAXON_ID=233186 /ORGANISM="Cryptomonas curvata, Strain CCAP979/52" /LENGTH=213 /DNA_ID=CAMNT_0012865773 /DNA_START=623 /DNA_END=1264 /DNA_ORIENTATION=+
MTRTFEQMEEKIGDVWLLDICRRIDRFERNFPELRDRSQSHSPPFSLWSGQFWRAVTSDLVVVVLSLPEVHFVKLCARSAWQQLVVILSLDHNELHSSQGVEALLKLECILEANLEQVADDAAHSQDRTDCRAPSFWPTASLHPWNKDIVNIESARLFLDIKGLIQRADACLSFEDLLEWRRVILGMMRRLLAQKTKPIRKLGQSRKVGNPVG